MTGKGTVLLGWIVMSISIKIKLNVISIKAKAFLTSQLLANPVIYKKNCQWRISKIIELAFQICIVLYKN